MKSIHFTLFFCSSLRSSLHNPLSNACADAWFNDNNIAHLRCRSIFRRCVQMRVDICGCVIAAVSKPLLYILHWYTIFQQQRSAGMSQIVKANTAQVIFPQDELEMLCYIVRLIGFSHIVYKDKFRILLYKQLPFHKFYVHLNGDTSSDLPLQYFLLHLMHSSSKSKGDIGSTANVPLFFIYAAFC